MPDTRLTIAYISAGAGGMYCGSCMHDNTLARALARRGVDVQLVPLYTPIRTDEENVSVDRVFFGGLNVHLQQTIPLFRHLPALVDRLLDQPWLLRWATSRAGEADPAQLGALTVSMLRGTSGYQRKEVLKLASWLAASVRPHLINFSNMLIAGCVPALKQQLGVPVLVTLQGDDIFLDELAEPYRARVFEEIRRLVAQVDGFLVNSRYYAGLMSRYLGIPPEKFQIVPLGIDTTDFQRRVESAPWAGDGRPPTVGYLARLAPEKGLHVLVDAFIELRRRPGMQTAQLRIAGWLGDRCRKYVNDQFDKLRRAGLRDAFRYAGELDRAAKIRFLSQIDVLSVPSIYRNPKGLYVLEALAAGVPVVQPAHGAFPELLASLEGGRLFRPGDAHALADELHAVLSNPPLRETLGQRGRRIVHDRYNADRMAHAVLDVYRQYVRGGAGLQESEVPARRP